MTEAFDITFAGAVFAGLLSFASPCVLPLVPAYLCFLGGTTFDQLTAEAGDQRARRAVRASALAFVCGFSVVFVTMGAGATLANRLLLDNIGWLSVAAGTVIIVFGLHYMGLWRIAFLNFERRAHVERRPPGLLGAFVIGLAFAFGWTPCVGPILATILMIAAGGDGVWYGTGLLTAYAAGLGVPFLLAALAAEPFMRLFQRLRRHMRTIEVSIGGLLVVTGTMILTGRLADASAWLIDAFPRLGRIG